MLRDPTPCRGGCMSSWLTKGTISTLLSGVAHFLFGLEKEFFCEATTKPKVQLAGLCENHVSFNGSLLPAGMPKLRPADEANHAPARVEPGRSLIATKPPSGGVVVERFPRPDCRSLPRPGSGIIVAECLHTPYRTTGPTRALSGAD